jgi:Uma2 family endonuclease
MYTIYNEDEGKYQLVEEPDPSITYTYADYMQWKFKERLELFRGRIFKMGAPNMDHQVIGGHIFFRLYDYLRGQICRVFIAPFDVRLPVRNHKRDDEITTVVQPDICIICDPEKLDKRGACGAPDLMIEILSPGNTKKEVREKFELYEEAGVREYWVIYPQERNVAVFLLNQAGKFDGAKIYADGDKLMPVAVPGFTIDVSEIFEE